MELQIFKTLDRATLNNEVAKVQTAVIEGEINPLDAFLFLKAIEDITAKAKAAISEFAMAEAQNFNGKQCEYKGTKIQVKAAAGKYDYAHIQRWAELKEEMKKLEEMAQSAYKSGSPAFITPDGETLEAAKYTPGRDTIAISFGK